MSPQAPRQSPEQAQSNKPWKPWVLDRMLESPTRRGFEPSAPSIRTWLLGIPVLCVLLGACVLLLWRGLGGQSEGAAPLDGTPSPTVQLLVPAIGTGLATPAPMTPSPMPMRTSPTPSPFPSPTATRIAVPAATPFKYKVKAGDTLLGIALKYGILVDSLREANGLSGDVFRVGEELVIPVSR
ncbi:MAG: LysM peptidoglycan-binding domain-containing protein [Chloroflexi bacterium]|nr:LysM peptidoglycan-binding domain-containing protein [Chloroflexota bacterium]